ncbi:glutaredoxin family protein [Pauljensenia sp. UMB1235]|uniref:glutaredoxin family protein n=1 Tax=unclassified Pauljensenia TaxID=2908895 RepID=UPI00254F4040|nr:MULTISPECIES: glutaredoxin family protein [unclassified Pauljensenia]MDK6399646.1 glutaredoxin family protein [Pauljensenia sp. UMB9872]MDK7172107.1 glutaredoxin family protein [Pauljensenia sp. UMB1235]
MDVTIYSKPNCPQCDATKRKFTKEGVAFREVDVTEDRRAFTRVRDEWGYQRVPVIEVRGEGFDVRWDGFRPERMKAVIDEFNRLVALSVEAGHDVGEEEARIAALVDGVVEALVNAREPHQYGFVDDSAQLSDERVNILLSGLNPHDEPSFNWVWNNEVRAREAEAISLAEQAGVDVDAMTQEQFEVIDTALMDNGEYVYFDDLIRHTDATFLRIPVQGFPGRSLEDIYDDIKEARDVNATASNGLVEWREGLVEVGEALSEYLASAGIDVELNKYEVAHLIEDSALSEIHEGVYLDVVWHGKFQEFIPDDFHDKTVTFTDPHVALGNSLTGDVGYVRLKGTMSVKIESRRTLERCGYPGDWHVRTDKWFHERARVERFISVDDELEMRRVKPVVARGVERDAQRFVTMLEQGAGSSRPGSFHPAAAHVSGFKVAQSARGLARGR